MGCASSNAAASPKVPAAASAPPRLPGTQEFQIFLTHDWGTDEHGRDNHARVKRVYHRLKELGVSAWFDEVQMDGDINGTMTEGIDKSTTVGVFVTDRYIAKASGRGESGANDNCKFEFDYALNQKGVESMIVLVMEKRCKNSKQWTGTVGGKLGNIMYIDLSKDGAPFEKGVQLLYEKIQKILAKTGTPVSATPTSATAKGGPHPQHRSAQETAASQPPATTRKLASISVEEVCTVLWNLGTLMSNELGKYEAGFRAVPVSGAVLATMNDEGLREVGVDMGIHRTALLHHIKEFQAGGVPLEMLVSVKGLVAERVKGSKDIGLIISLMGAHKPSAGVQEAGCVSLQGLTDDKDGKDPNKMAVAAKGGIEAVLTAMGAHESIAGVQENGCGAVRNLARNAENAAAIAAQGGIAAVLRAMGAHASSAEVQEQGCSALINLAANHAESAAAIAAQGGIAAVLRAMGAHA
eukprot:CAMPEP_0180141772 /NCGR_PEP_ID=MMETSP0986-20121125/15136_1 /TAXON_ID=697907 /ORGANISM="non described non described, Strain CCMP2293" /LENGTH=466 /DNA_ID=CAMNT_0022084747 /DNA_START=199 /DNA_END=1595 /DNA_ORIENTATION=+